MKNLEDQYRQALVAADEKGLRRSLRPISNASTRLVERDGQDYLNFTSNDYLGLSQHPEMIAAAQEWTESLGTGGCSSRLISGNRQEFDRIERKVAALKKKPAALVMASGFQTNAGVIAALLDRQVAGEPLVFSDRSNHASLHFGCQAAGVRQHRYRHLDMAHLEDLLKRHRTNSGTNSGTNSDQPAFIISDSVFSMEGDQADVSALVELAREHNAFLILDEAHATGMFGEDGGGLSTAYPDGVDLVLGTFSKAFGGFGGYVACSEILRDYLIQRCGGLIYSTALPPAVLAAMDAALDLVPTMATQRSYALKLANQFRAELTRRGLSFGGSNTQIVPLYFDSLANGLALSESLENQGILAVTIRPPTVAPKTTLIRFSFTAAHREEDLKQLLRVLDHSLSALSWLKSA